MSHCMARPHILLVSLYIDEHLGCFYLLALMNSTIVNMHVIYLFEHLFPILLGVNLKVEVLGRMVTLWLTFWGSTWQYSGLRARILPCPQPGPGDQGSSAIPPCQCTFMEGLWNYIQNFSFRQQIPSCSIPYNSKQKRRKEGERKKETNWSGKWVTVNSCQPIQILL